VSTSETTPPFFIVGCPRSGTTLLSRILDRHSRIAVSEETIYYPLFRDNLHRYGDLRRPSNVRRLIDDLRGMIRLQGVDPPSADDLQKDLIAPTFEGVLATYLHLYARDRGKSRAGEKTARHHAYLGEILEKFPDSPVIFLVRDPRDTVASIRKMFHNSLQSAIRSWNDAFQSYRRTADSVHLVQYEELVRAPVVVVDRICALLGEAYEPEMLRFFEHVPEHLRRLPHHGKLLKPVDADSVGTFRGLSTREIAQIESACAPGMEAMRYSFTSSPGIRLASAPASRLNWLNGVLDRLRLYRARPDLVRVGWLRWKMRFGVRIRFVLTLGPLRKIRA
jgi:hypothetical protein